MDLIQVGLPTISIEYCTVAYSVGAFDLALFTVEDVAFIAGYLHQVEKVVHNVLNLYSHIWRSYHECTGQWDISPQSHPSSCGTCPGTF